MQKISTKKQRRTIFVYLVQSSGIRNQTRDNIFGINDQSFKDSFSWSEFIWSAKFSRFILARNELNNTFLIRQIENISYLVYLCASVRPVRDIIEMKNSRFFF